MRTPASLHLWWARRPLTLCRAVIASCLLPAPRDKLEEKYLLSALSRACTLNASYRKDHHDLKVIRDAIQRHWHKKSIRMLDPFAGGGSIPLEGLRLGIDVYARDLNPVSFLIRECGLKLIPQYPTRPQNSNSNVSKGLLEEQIRSWASRIENIVKSRLNNPSNPDTDVFGQEGVISYIWVKTAHCVSCGLEIPLLSLTRLRSTNGEDVNIGIDVDHDQGKFILFPTKSESIKPFLGRKYVYCPFCEQKKTSLKDIKQQASDWHRGLGVAPVAKILPSRAKIPRTFVQMEKDDLTFVKKAFKMVEQERNCNEWFNCFPNEDAPPEGALGCINAAYGMNSFDLFFTPRQSLVLANFVREIIYARESLLESMGDSSKTRAISMCLAFTLDRLADYNSLLTSWHVSKQITRNTFPAGQLRMTWDFVEANPFTPGSGSWSSAVRTTIAGIRACSSRIPGQLLENQVGSSTELPYKTKSFDLVVTDPPWGDNMSYSHISDFFYVWLKRTVGSLYPKVFLDTLTPKEEELIVSGRFKRERKRFHSRVEQGLTQSFLEANRVLKQNGLMVVMFTHRSFSAWAQMVRCIQTGGFRITTAWPVSSELRTKIAPTRSNILVSILLVCRPVNRRMREERSSNTRIIDVLHNRVRSRIALFAEHFNSSELSTAMMAPTLEAYSTISGPQDDEGRLLEELYCESLRVSRDYRERS